MMETTFSNLLVFFTLCLMIGSSVFFKHHIKRYALIVFILIGSWIGFSVYTNIITSHDDFYSIKLSSQQHLSLYIDRSDVDSPRLYDQDNQMRVTYLNYAGKNTKIKHYHPVFLKAFDDYYVLIYSQDPQRNYDHGYYIQNDYERFNDIDKMMILNRTTGEFTHLRLYDYIGRTIDLNHIRISKNFLLIPNLYKHTRHFQYVEAIYLYKNRGFSFGMLYYSSCSQTSCDYVTTHYVDDHGISIHIYNQERLMVHQLIPNIQESKHSLTFSGNRREITNNLSHELHLLNGEIMYFNGLLYFYSVDGYVYTFSNTGTPIKTDLSASLENWRSIVLNT